MNFLKVTVGFVGSHVAIYVEVAFGKGIVGLNVKLDIGPSTILFA